MLILLNNIKHSGRFDYPVIFSSLLKALKNIDGEIPNILKRGAKYFTISTKKFLFNDTLNFKSPCRLSDYLEQWRVVEKKSIFPYQKYSSVEDLQNDTEFPPEEDFYDCLKQKCVDPDLYKTASDHFYKCKALPDNHPLKMRNMRDWLRYYNVLDVGPLCEAMSRSFECFHAYFQLDATQFLSLPRIALEAVLKSYDQKSSFIFTFGEKWNDYRKAHRDNVNGGCVAVYHRDVNLMDDDGPLANRIAPDGNPFTFCIQLDFNALYAQQQMKPMPTTPGVLWKRVGNTFHKSVMCDGNSLGATQWMYFLEATHHAVKDGGIIQHFFHRKEVRLENDLVDGFIQGEQSYIFEYNGCRFHGCCQFEENQMEKRRLFEEKIIRLERFGKVEGPLSIIKPRMN